VADKKQRTGWLLAVGLVVASAIFVVVAKVVLVPERTTQPAPRTQATADRPATPAPAEPEPTAREPLPMRAPEEQAPDQAEKEPVGPRCARSEDCRGPKSADCVVASCESGHCVFDRSSCECALDAECDDGVECTKDLCFGATKKCIHMRSGCD